MMLKSLAAISFIAVAEAAPLIGQIESLGLGEAAKQVPALAVLVFALVWFLRHLDTVDKRRAEADARRDEMYDKIDARRDAADVRRNAVMATVATSYDRNTEVLGRAVATLDRVEDVIGNGNVRISGPRP